MTIGTRRNRAYDYYTDELKRFKTVSSKKAFLTRSKKAVQEYIDDLNWALDGRGWLRGERVYQEHLWNQKGELAYIEILYNELKK